MSPDTSGSAANPATGCSSALLTDFYELTMMQGYVLNAYNPRAVFDMFYRRNPFQGGFALCAGLEDLIDALDGLRFSSRDIDYLRREGTLDPEFLKFLDTFRFTAELAAVPEGTVVFPNEPLVRVRGTLAEAQLVESRLLNTVNFQTLIATKAARICSAARGGRVLEFGLRRAQGVNGALSAARAAYVGGAAATSNVHASACLGIPAKGTMAHSWVMAHESEYKAFVSFAEMFPDSAVLLIDTYDTLGSGLDAAVRVFNEMRGRLGTYGVRIDSGDLDLLSREVRRRLDDSGHPDAVIVASNELDEHDIEALVSGGAPIDLWGVGTKLVTGGSESSLTGVYKLAAVERNGVFEPVLKVSDDPAKTTNPGVKQIHRFVDGSGRFVGDVLALEDEPARSVRNTLSESPSEGGGSELLLSCVMRDGRRSSEKRSLDQIQEYAASQLEALPERFKRLTGWEEYPVLLSPSLRDRKASLLERYD